jgi:hypothetical protein
MIRRGGVSYIPASKITHSKRWQIIPVAKGSTDTSYKGRPGGALPICARPWPGGILMRTIPSTIVIVTPIFPTWEEGCSRSSSIRERSRGTFSGYRALTRTPRFTWQLSCRKDRVPQESWGRRSYLFVFAAALTLNGLPPRQEIEREALMNPNSPFGLRRAQNSSH